MSMYAVVLKQIVGQMNGRTNADLPSAYGQKHNWDMIRWNEGQEMVLHTL